MVVAFWVSIVTTVILASVAFLAPYVIERWKYKFYAPKLDFEFEFEPPYCHLTEMRRYELRNGKLENEVRFPVYYFRFAVVNSGKLQADDCEAVLEKVWEEDSAGNLQEWENFSPVNLKWSGGDPKAYLKTIHPGRNDVFCDIGRIHHPKYEPESVYVGISEEEKQRNKFFFELPQRFFSQWDCLMPGKYQIEISVYSKNAQKTTRRFKISWSGDWKDTEERMFRQIVIS